MRVFLITMIFTLSITYSQGRSDLNNENLGRQVKEDSISVEKVDAIKQPKNFTKPAIGIITLNMGVWAYNKYLTKQGWSEIGVHTVKKNIKTGFAWDNDGFLMNQFAHPYHGSMYYNIARSNGLDFWESSIYPYAGSLIWELFMENQAPSYNDIINTPVSGILLGEISYRVSDLILDESQTGMSRVVSETMFLVVNPMRFLNRLMKGDVWRYAPLAKKQFYIMHASLGANNIYYDLKRSNRKIYALTGLELQYGQLTKTSGHNKPYDYFNMKGEIYFTERDNIVNLNSSGVIWDSKIKSSEKVNTVFGIYQDLDLLINMIYKFTATKVTGAITNETVFSNKNRFLLSAGISYVVLGGANSDYATLEGKDYNLGPGAAVSISAKYHIGSSYEVFLNYKNNWIHTLSGARGEEFAAVLESGIQVRISQNLYLCNELNLYHQFSYYAKYKRRNEWDSVIKTYLSFVF